MKIINRQPQEASGYDWSTGVLIGMDTETTSADPRTARIVSSAIVVSYPSGEYRCREWLSNPEIDIGLEATAIHGISTEYAMTNGQDASVVITEMLEILSGFHAQYPDVPLIMVNAPFDLTIMRQEMIRLNIGKLEKVSLPPVIDTLTCDRRLDTYRRGRRTLTATAAAYGVTIKGAHTAIGDIKCSIRLIRAMAKKYPQFATCDLRRLQALQTIAHDEWCAQYETYRRIDDSGFMISRGWPYQQYDNEVINEGMVYVS
jgi:DNA polymerase-3 subunit epsilon